MSLLLESLLRRDRNIVAGSLVLVALACWAFLLTGAGMGMSGLEMTRHSLMKMDGMMSASWDAPYISLMFFMWWIMMIAMMLPSASPVILLANALNRRAEPGKQPFGSTGSFVLGYLLAWALFSAFAVGLQWLLADASLISGMLKSRSHLLSAALLIVAGGWQFSPWKYACLRHCRGPVEYLTANKRKGNAGALLMGMTHGAYCLGCCWFLMILLFVGGVMNLIWIAGLAIYVWVEKVLPSGELVSRIMGGLLIAWGIGILMSPYLAM